MEEKIDNQEVKPDIDLKKALSAWGNYKKKENCVYLYDNVCLNDEDFKELIKAHKVKIQLDMFS